jgi:hypothetical protein
MSVNYRLKVTVLGPVFGPPLYIHTYMSVNDDNAHLFSQQMEFTKSLYHKITVVT